MNNTPSHSEANGPGQHGSDPASVKRLVPLTVWLCSDSTATTNTNAKNDRVKEHADRRTKAGQLCARHRQAVGGQLARHLISTCTAQGDVVAEAYATSEATLCAAAELGRLGAACVPHFPLAQYIGARLRATIPKENLPDLAMRPCRPDQMARGMADLAGRVGLVIAAPPPYEVGGRPPKRAGEKDCPACRADLWALTEQQLGGFLTAAWRVLRPGGTLAVITTARHEGGRLIDPAPRIIRHCTALGFRYVQHVIALRVPIEGEALVVQAGPADLAHLRDTQTGPPPPVVSVHADVCLFTKPRRKGGAR